MAEKKPHKYYKGFGERGQAYLSPRYAKLSLAYAFDHQEGHATTLKSIIKQFFDNKTDIEVKRLLHLFDTMSEEEKRNPGKR